MQIDCLISRFVIQIWIDNLILFFCDFYLILDFFLWFSCFYCFFSFVLMNWYFKFCLFRTFLLHLYNKVLQFYKRHVGSHNNGQIPPIIFYPLFLHQRYWEIMFTMFLKTIPYLNQKVIPVQHHSSVVTSTLEILPEHWVVWKQNNNHE